MQQYLVGYSIIHRHGNAVSRDFVTLPTNQIVTRSTIMTWELAISQTYSELKDLTIRIFTFQEL